MIQSGHWTLDNLTTNDTMLQYLQKGLEECEITSFDAKENRIMCFPHIINIAVHVVSTCMSSTEVPDCNDDPEVSYEAETDGCNKDQTFEDACAGDPINRLRKIIIAIRSSGQRKDAFNAWIVTGNEHGWFILKGAPVKIIARQLLRDVRTRWDSTYLMIRRCIEMRLVCIYFLYIFVI